MKSRKIIIFSDDAMIGEDVDYLLNKPFVQKIYNEGVWIRSLKTVFPSVTYPCHSSMITGCYPDKTGVDTNYYDGTTDWRAARSNIKIKTLLDYAKEKGLTIANVFWPVLSNDESVDYNIPEVFPKVDEFISVLKNNGSSDEVIEKIVKPNLSLLKCDMVGTEPYTGDFLFACAIDILKAYNPDVLLIHACPHDAARHKFGPISDLANAESLRIYDLVCKLMNTVNEIGEGDNTDFIWMSDHGQMPIIYWTRPLTLLTKAGLITLDKDNNVIDSKVDFWQFNISLMIKVKDKKDYKKVKKVLEDGEKTQKGYKLYDKKTATKLLHIADYDYDFLIDSDGFNGIGKEPYGEYNTSLSDGVVKVLGIHGYNPDVSYQPTFMAIGPDFKKGLRIDRTETVNIPVTLAKCLNITLEDVDGVCLNEILDIS